ncbi:acyl-CoA dehydrogenase family protein [Aestuariibacter halophilus]|uniref:Acyl-CoA dehydrogenase family protein n=1 Tax=Fluctibacter halophilus TaxID=226011 RepID=A0ABS8G750_9ALTE|nr:acyl-CoA dehydrogenase family protein [Aestuariibacter halophilus]MCC2616412.1 acyl-CoA dehydrogenase family protein [Aestuariibacter halophilus]
MPQYVAPLTDIQFILHDWLELDKHYASLGMADFDKELVNEVLAQGGKFAEQVIAPLNREGDEQSCTLADGKVTTPDGFAQAYQEYIVNGWNAMLGSAEYDGQDLPYSMAVPVHEMLNSANVSWRLISMLTESAVLAVSKHADEQLKQTYLAKLISGEWTGTMCLTEPHAGTDLALLSSKAEPNDDGTYQITGSKIFISGGDQDWTDNIVHMVLARLPDAPAGVKGISLFLVPKFIPDNQGNPGQANSLSVGSLEKKMGLKGCPTCVMNFDGATGYLVGAPHTGLACMFTMMNDARFQVGLQGLGLAEAAYQGALSYARERLQSRAPQGAQQPDSKADPILHQPDVRRMLLTQKALTEGCRALAYLYATQMDIEKYADDEADKGKAGQVLAFLTPICKAFMTDMGQESGQHGVQVFGGHGYIREWGMEQLIRDSRISQLYEGTNGIQAADLISRKLARDSDSMLAATTEVFQAHIARIADTQQQAKAQALLDEWHDLSVQLRGLSAVDLAGAANDYLAYSAYMLLGVLWLSMADRASSSETASLAQGKAKTCAFYLKRLLPRAATHKAALLEGAEDLVALADDEFDYQ